MIEHRIKPQNRFSLGGKELWQYRELFYFFTWRDIKVRYKQATLGVLWAIIQPLSMMLLFTLVFGKGLEVSSDGMPYPIFAFSGLMIWTLFSSSLQNAATSMVSNQAIITKIYFPRLIIPLSAILTALFDWSFAFIVWGGLIIYFQLPIVLWKLFYVLISVLLTTLTVFGLGSFLAAMNVKYRDFQYMLPFFIQFLLFLNPVVYSTSIFDNYPVISYIMELNPIAGSINLVRSIISNTPIDGILLIQQFIVAILFLIGGLYVFRTTESYFADLI